MTASMHRYTCHQLGVCQERTPPCTEQCAAIVDHDCTSDLSAPVADFNAAVKMVVQLIVAVLIFFASFGFCIYAVLGWKHLLGN